MAAGNRMFAGNGQQDAQELLSRVKSPPWAAWVWSENAWGITSAPFLGGGFRDVKPVLIQLHVFEILG